VLCYQRGRARIYVYRNERPKEKVADGMVRGASARWCRTDDPNLYLAPTIFDIPWHRGQKCVVLVGPGGHKVDGIIGEVMEITTVCYLEELSTYRMEAETQIIHYRKGVPVKMGRRASVVLRSLKKNEFFDGMYMLRFDVHP